MSVRLDQLPADVRRKIQGQAKAKPKRRQGRVDSLDMRCCTCGEVITVRTIGATEAIRHVDEMHGSGRVEVVLP